MGLGGEDLGLIAYANVPRTIGTLISHKVATLNELQTVYGMADVYNMLEILYVDNANQEIMRKRGGRGNNY